MVDSISREGRDRDFETREVRFRTFQFVCDIRVPAMGNHRLAGRSSSRLPEVVGGRRGGEHPRSCERKRDNRGGKYRRATATTMFAPQPF